jgi:2-iminoacetate synthase
MDFLNKYKKEMAEYDKMEKDFIDDDLIWKQLNAAEIPQKNKLEPF